MGRFPGRHPRDGHRLLPLMLLLLMSAGSARPARAATIRVPADLPTVRAAAAVAAAGDTVLIAPGTHAGGVFVNGKSLVFASEFVMTGDTALVAQTVLSGVAADVCGGAPGCAGNAVLEFGGTAGGAVIGLTITGGENGVSAAAAVDIANCRVIGNGDGVDYVDGSAGTFRNSLFANNSDDGIDLNGRLSVRIIDNVIRDNRDDGIEYRLYAYSGPMMLIEVIGNRISGNDEDGIQLIDYPDVSSRVIRIDRNIFSANFDASGASAAIGCMPNGETIENLIGAPIPERIVVTNNTFIGEQNGLVGGANVIALNNIFVGTQAGALRRVAGSSITSYSLFWNNGVDYDSSTVDLPHLVFANPLLDANGVPTNGGPAIDGGTAFFQWNGETVLDIPPSGYQGTAPDLGAVEVGGTVAVNQPPAVDAGAGQSIVLPATAALDGTVSDDGMPSPPALTSAWSVDSGPGAVTFEDASAVDTRAAFAAAGTYVLRLSANDGQLAASDTVTVTVAPEPPVNQPPAVDAGADQSIVLPATAALDGTVSDDGLPSPPALTSAWSVDSGPGAVTFEDASAVDTRATFASAGTYVLRLAASDGALSASDVVTVTVGVVEGTIEQRIAAAGDDVEEEASGVLSANVSDLELVDNGNLQKVGLRFVAVAIPAGARISSAYLQFEADETQNEPTTLAIHGQAADNAAPFTSSSGTVSGRTRTAASASWSPPAWTSVGQAGAAQRTTDLAAVIQEIVDRPGWASGNAMAFIITGTGHRTARSYEGRAAGAPLLHVEYGSAPPPPVNLPPVVDAGADQAIVLPATAALDGTASDDGLPSPPALTTLWSVDSGPGPVAFDDAGAVDTRASFSVRGSYVLRLTASDGALSAADLVLVTVQAESGALDRTIATSSDDVEEDATGVMNLSSTDIELVFNATLQTVGLRFTDLTIPRGAEIVRAHVQFETDEVQDEPTQLVIQGQAADHAAPFTGVGGNASSRGRTAAAVGWSPPAWTTVGEAGAAQRTPDLSAIFQEIVNRPGWAKGNAAVILITGTGHRTAASFDGTPAGAARLHLEYGTALNQAPVVDAGAPQDVMLPSDALLEGTVSDDGLPNAATLSTTWSVASGPGPVAFEDAGARTTRVAFTTVGTYVLQLTAVDGELSATDSVRIRVHPGSGTMDLALASGSDDVEEDGTGVMNLTSLDLEMTSNMTNQLVGLRFTGVAVPPRARVARAYVQFQADETQSEVTSLVIQGQASDNAGTFSVNGYDLSDRARTEASVFWSVPVWELIGEAGEPQQSPDLSSLLQEIVNRPGWESGNAVALVISGTGRRTAVAYDRDPATAARLHVEFGRFDAPMPTRGSAARAEEQPLLEVPRIEFALHGPSRSPARGGALGVEFSLPDAGAATLELLDVTGRRLAVREVGSLGAGRHQVELRRHLSAGVYLVRLTRQDQARTIKAAVLR